MRIVFFIYNFIVENLPLQPWLTIRYVAEGLARRGHNVHLVSDASDPARIEDIELHTVASLRGPNSAEVRSLIARIEPETIVFLPTPLNIAITSWLDLLNCRRVGFVSYPFYNTGELLKAMRCVGLLEIRKYLRHLLVPKFVWSRAIRRRLHALIIQSTATTVRLKASLEKIPECLCIPPGIEMESWPYKTHRVKMLRRPVHLLYLGAADGIRGFSVMLDAFAQIKNSDFRMRILARGADTERMIAIRAAIERRGLQARIEIKGGWISHSQLVEEIHVSDAVLQPFVLVPSELPVTALEAIACGTPVIGSDIDGLPSAIGPAGMVVRQGSASSLAEGISRFTQDVRLREACQEGCLQQRKKMLDWSAVSEQWEAVLGA